MIWEFTATDDSKLFIDLEAIVAVGREHLTIGVDSVDVAVINTESFLFRVKESLSEVVRVWHQSRRGVLESPASKAIIEADLMGAISEIQTGNGWLVSRSPGSLRVSANRCTFAFTSDGENPVLGSLSLSWISGVDFYLSGKRTPKRFKELTESINFKFWEYLLENEKAS